MGEELKQKLIEQYKREPIFSQAVEEFLEAVIPFLVKKGATEEDYALLERMTVPDRIITFKVVWEDDNGTQQYNIGFRVQFNSALGPYKGGLRFDPSVNVDVLKFLGFEQIFKNALTGLPLGAGKGGSTFDPKGRSDAEIRRFSTSFMTELNRYIGARTDVPAGDIGVGEREIGYLYGAYKKISNRADGILTGKGTEYSGSHIRMEATGYGTVYFVEEMLARQDEKLIGKRVVVSGSGNVALHAAEKLIEEGAIVLTLSDRGGYIFSEMGFDQDFVGAVKELKQAGGRLADLKLSDGMTYKEGKPWRDIPADIYLPCATQNEVNEDDAKAMLEHGAKLIAEGANMPLSLPALHVVAESGILFGPAKAANAGGVAVSGLEMSQNAGHTSWTRESVDKELRNIMRKIHQTCVAYGEEGGKVNYERGANIGGFVRVFDTMKQLGW